MTAQITYQGQVFYISFQPIDTETTWAVLEDDEGNSHQLGFNTAEATEFWPSILRDVEINGVSIWDITFQDKATQDRVGLELDSITKG